MTVRKWKCIAFAIFAMSSFDRMLWTSADFDKLTTPNQCNEREEGWENKRETRELLQFWIHWKQLWHWYWNIAGINTIYLSIFTLIYSPSIQYNEIIEGLSPRRNIRFNPGLLMVSKRDGRGKEKIFSMTFNGGDKESLELLLAPIALIPTRVVPSHWKAWLIDGPSHWPVRPHYPTLHSLSYKSFASWPSGWVACRNRQKVWMYVEILNIVRNSCYALSMSWYVNLTESKDTELHCWAPSTLLAGIALGHLSPRLWPFRSFLTPKLSAAMMAVANLSDAGQVFEHQIVWWRHRQIWTLQNNWFSNQCQLKLLIRKEHNQNFRLLFCKLERCRKTWGVPGGATDLLWPNKTNPWWPNYDQSSFSGES